jgi:tetratricopeptide (TPR) repeat protein
MPHAFDAFTDTDEARRLLQQTIAFWRSHLEPVPQPPWQPSPARAIMAALFGNQADRAAELLGPWVEQHPGDAVAWTQYGRNLAALQRFPEAEAAYLRAFALDSTDLGVLSGLATARIATQRWPEAERFLQLALAQGARSSQLFGQLGWVQLQLNRNAEAARSYEQAFELGIPPGRNTRGVAWYNLGCAYVRLGRVDDAFTALGRAVDEGLVERRVYQGDTDLDPLRGDARFARLMERLSG